MWRPHNKYLTHPVGDLSKIITKYVSFKRSLGLKYENEEKTLFRFSHFSLDFKIENGQIPDDLTELWFTKRPFEKNNTYNARIGIVRMFLIVAAEHSYSSNIPESPRLKSEKYQPYIFSIEEMKLFFDSSDNLTPYNGSWQHIISPVLFRLIYGCGLRASEAVNLKCENIDWENNTLTIYIGKFSKDRIIPFSKSVRAVLKEYYQRYQSDDTDNSYLFPTKYNTHLSRENVYTWFRVILEKAGIPHLGKGRGPREHDLTSEFYPEVQEKMRNYSGDIIPAVGGDTVEAN